MNATPEREAFEAWLDTWLDTTPNPLMWNISDSMFAAWHAALARVEAERDAAVALLRDVRSALSYTNANASAISIAARLYIDAIDSALAAQEGSTP